MNRVPFRPECRDDVPTEVEAPTSDMAAVLRGWSAWCYQEAAKYKSNMSLEWWESRAEALADAADVIEDGNTVPYRDEEEFADEHDVTYLDENLPHAVDVFSPLESVPIEELYDRQELLAWLNSSLIPKPRETREPEQWAVTWYPPINKPPIVKVFHSQSEAQKFLQESLQGNGALCYVDKG